MTTEEEATKSATSVTTTPVDTNNTQETKKVEEVEEEVDVEEEEEEEEEEDPSKLFCLCRKPYNGDFMVQCDFCQDWFHPKCVGISRVIARRLDEYKCPRCEGKVSNIESEMERRAAVLNNIKKRRRGDSGDAESRPYKIARTSTRGTASERNEESDDAAHDAEDEYVAEGEVDSEELEEDDEYKARKAPTRRVPKATSHPPRIKHSSASSAKQSADKEAPAVSPKQKVRDAAITSLSDALRNAKDRLATAGSDASATAGAFALGTAAAEFDTTAFARKIEHELYTLFHGDVGKDYKTKVRSLIFNIKDERNRQLISRIVSGVLTPRQLSLATANELAYQELADWRNARERTFADSVVIRPEDTTKFVKKTHKGEQEVEAPIETTTASVSRREALAVDDEDDEDEEELHAKRKEPAEGLEGHTTERQDAGADHKALTASSRTLLRSSSGSSSSSSVANAPISSEESLMRSKPPIKPAAASIDRPPLYEDVTVDIDTGKLATVHQVDFDAEMADIDGANKQSKQPTTSFPSKPPGPVRVAPVSPRTPPGSPPIMAPESPRIEKRPIAPASPTLSSSGKAMPVVCQGKLTVGGTSLAPCNVRAVLVRGPAAISSPASLEKLLPDTWQIAGRTPLDKLATYLLGLAKSTSRDYTIARLDPETTEADEMAYIAMFHYFSERARAGVVVNLLTSAVPAIKELYVMPVSSEGERTIAKAIGSKESAGALLRDKLVAVLVTGKNEPLVPAPAPSPAVVTTPQQVSHVAGLAPGSFAPLSAFFPGSGLATLPGLVPVGGISAATTMFPQAYMGGGMFGTTGAAGISTAPATYTAPFPSMAYNPAVYSTALAPQTMTTAISSAIPSTTGFTPAAPASFPTPGSAPPAPGYQA